MSTPITFLTQSRTNSMLPFTKTIASACLIVGLTCLPGISSAQDTPNPQRAGIPSPKQLGMNLGIQVPTGLFQLGCLHCRKGEQTEAARYIEDAIKLLVKQSRRTTKNGKAVLEQSIDELQMLSDRLKSGAEISATQLEKSFARAHYALAYHHHELATAAWARRKFKETGEEMKAAVYYTQSGAFWLGQTVEKKTKDAFQATYDVGKQLARGAKQDAIYVESRSRILGSQIHEFGKRLITSKKKRTAKRP